MSTMSLITIVVPIYNVEKYLEEALDSVVNQTYKKLQIILVNDGSTDNSKDIIEKYRKKDDRIRVVTQKNKGLSEARNSGLKLASGKYIYFFDSDDILELNAMEICVGKAEEDNLDLVLFDGLSFEDETNKKLFPNKYRLTGKVEENKIYKGTTFLEQENYIASACLKFIKLDILKEKKLNFYSGILHEDELFTPLLFMGNTRVGYLNQVFFHRRVRKNSIMTQKISEKNILGYLTVIRELSKVKCSKSTENLINKNIRTKISMIILNSSILKVEKKYFKIIESELEKYLNVKLKLKLKFNRLFLLFVKLKKKLKYMLKRGKYA